MLGGVIRRLSMWRPRHSPASPPRRPKRRGSDEIGPGDTVQAVVLALVGLAKPGGSLLGDEEIHWFLFPSCTDDWL